MSTFHEVNVMITRRPVPKQQDRTSSNFCMNILSELMKMKVKKNPREKVCAIFKIDHYLNRINQFFSNMEDFLEMQKKVAQIGGLQQYR